MSTGRTTKVLGFSVPPAVVREVESLAREERRTKSELFREMVRVYQKYRLQRDRDELRWINGIIDEARAEQRTSPVSGEALLAEDSRLSRYGQQQAMNAGLKTDSKSISRIVHERRKANRP
jgi:metal-responsive CopG/Arc/MetJ family transcriptional regulator